MRKNPKLLAILFTVLLTAALSGLTVVGQSQGLAPYEKQFVSLWEETYTQLLPVRWGGMSPQEASALQVTGAPFFLLDVRTPTEFQTERIAGAVNIPLDQLPARLNELPTDREMIVVIYCKAGQRGGLGFALLRQFGYVNVKNMIGGLNAWKSAGLPVDTTPVSTPPPNAQPTVLAPYEKQFVSLWLVRQLGYVNAKNMTGGLDAWRAAGYPVEP